MFEKGDIVIVKKSNERCIVVASSPKSHFVLTVNNNEKLVTYTESELEIYEASEPPIKIGIRKKMKTKLLIMTLLVSTICNAQSFFKPLPKYVERAKYSFKLQTSGDSAKMTSLIGTMNAFRPIANIAAYTIPGNILMTGAGVSYQHLTIDSTMKWYCQWSISALMWAGGQIAPTNGNYSVMSFGIMFGVLNNLIMVGPALNNGKVIGVISIGVSLNN
jgi:hypothetical protein